MNADILSISGVHTRMALREADVVMDLGIADEAAMRCHTALLTHLHADHASASWTWAAQGAFRYEGSRTMVCHETVLDQLQAFLEAGRAMNGGEDELPTLIGAAPGTRVALPMGGRYALALGTVHRVPSCGWALVEKRRKTLPELAGAPPEVFRRYKAEGRPIHQETEVIPFAYTGDTTVEGLIANPEFFRAEHLAVECTYHGEFPVREARARGHIHLEELLDLARVGAFPAGQQVTLTHFSPRYNEAQIETARNAFERARKGER